MRVVSVTVKDGKVCLFPMRLSMQSRFNRRAAAKRAVIDQVNKQFVLCQR
jgi:hypothetical protein